MSVLRILPDIYSVGTSDWNVRTFHGHTYSTNRGTTYNAYLILDEKNVLVDTVAGHFADEMIENIRQIIPAEKIDYVVANHVETDHSGALPAIDAPLFASKDVAVIGGGNSALDAALQLIRIARHTYIINIAASLGGDAIMREKVEASKNVAILNSTQVTAILGDKFVNGIRIKREGRQEQLTVQGVFIEIGLLPNSDFAKDVEKNQFGEIKVNSRNETNLPGIFAAGDVTDVPEKQIIIAAGEGAKAALSAFRYLAQHK